jgi:hypothetical protein
MKDPDKNEYLGPTHWHVNNSGTDWPGQTSVSSRAKFNIGNSLIVFLCLTFFAIALKYALEVF